MVRLPAPEIAPVRFKDPPPVRFTVRLSVSVRLLPMVMLEALFWFSAGSMMLVGSVELAAKFRALPERARSAVTSNCIRSSVNAPRSLLDVAALPVKSRAVVEADVGTPLVSQLATADQLLLVPDPVQVLVNWACAPVASPPNSNSRSRHLLRDLEIG